jgi:hypothetical protein
MGLFRGFAVMGRVRAHSQTVAGLTVRMKNVALGTCYGSVTEDDNGPAFTKVQSFD